MAGRAFMYGTAACAATAGLALLGARHLLGLRSVADVGEAARERLQPLDGWLGGHARELHASAEDAQAQLAGATDAASERWRGTAVGEMLRRWLARGSDAPCGNGSASGAASDGLTEEERRIVAEVVAVVGGEAAAPGSKPR